jgi:hypothetical protein
MINLIFSLIIYLHPIHISVADIHYREDRKSLEIMLRIFVDDLELSIRNLRLEPELDILYPQNGLSTQDMVVPYLKDRFKIYLDGKAQTYNFLGFEMEGEAMVCFIEVEKVKKWQQIKVHNSIITETYDDQNNLVHVTVNNKVKSMRLTRQNPEGTLGF